MAFSVVPFQISAILSAQPRSAFVSLWSSTTYSYSSYIANIPCKSHCASADFTVYCLGMEVVWGMAAQQPALTTADLSEMSLFGFWITSGICIQSPGLKQFEHVSLFCLLSCVCPPSWQRTYGRTQGQVWHGAQGEQEQWSLVTHFMCHPWKPLALGQGKPVFSSEYSRSVIAKQ